ncbi:hypothetical protein FACS1894211_06390 [Clostridia bacterium]|nr:hypothetical protein FACS1894211_06390 [Clostridia bacterium]
MINKEGNFLKVGIVTRRQRPPLAMTYKDGAGRRTLPAPTASLCMTYKDGGARG